jgi:hypothetical protein
LFLLDSLGYDAKRKRLFVKRYHFPFHHLVPSKSIFTPVATPFLGIASFNSGFFLFIRV